MITIYTVSSCTSCKKAKTWLNAHQLTYKEQNLGKEGITKEELLDILTKTENGVASIVSSKNRYAKGLGVDIEELSVSEVIDLIMETPRILKSPILVDDTRKTTFVLSCLVQSVMLKIQKHVCVPLYNTKRVEYNFRFFVYHRRC